MILRRLFSRKKLDADLGEEMREHLLERIEALVANGMPLSAARETAQREFGNLTLLEERARDVWRWPILETLLYDIRFGARRLRHSPGLSLICMLTLALGLGANLALFSLVQTVLLKPLPFEDPERLVAVYEATGIHNKNTFNVVAAGSFADWRRESDAFTEMAFWGWGSRNLSGQSGQLPEKLETRRCTWNFFHTLGVRPAYGRFFSATDDKRGAPATTVLTWGLFQRRFGGDPAIVGQTILLDGEPYTVIGVLPSWFTFPDRKGQLWTPAYREMPAAWAQSHGIHAWNAIARLKPGVSAASAVAEVSVIQGRIHKQFPNDPAMASAGIQPLLDEMVGEFKTPLYILLAAVGCVLFITCLNVASLLLARSVARSKEIALRSALGGSGWRIVQEQLVESLLLALGGGVLSAGVAYGLIRWIVSVRQDLPRIESLHVDFPLLIFGVCLTLATGFISGLLPALAFRSESLLNILQESSRAVKGGRSAAALRKYLVSVEVAFTAVLLIGAGLLLKSFTQLRSVPVGCNTANVLTMGISLPNAKYKEPEKAAEFIDALLGDVRALPGVRSAGVISTLPGGGYSGDTLFTIPEHPPLPKGEFQFAIFRGAGPETFRTLQIPVLQGRVFTGHDRLSKEHRVIVSAGFARKSFPREDPIGKHLRVDWGGVANFEIIGVVGDTPYNIARPVLPMMYFPIENQFREFSVAVRTDGDPLRLALPIQKIVARIDPDLGIANILTFDQVIGRSLSSRSFEAAVVAGFAILSLLLASIGLYGVLSYMITQRKSEIGIRIALGAQRGELIRRMLLDGLKPALLGLLFGVAAGIAATRLMRSVLFGTAPTDISVFAGVVLTILLVAVLACAIPAFRASALDPIAALRTG